MNKLSIKITSNAKSLTSFSGLNLFDDLIQKFEIRSLFGPFLPKKFRDRGFTSWNKIYAGVLGFIAGAQCLDDLDYFGLDPLFSKLTNSPSAITIGKFLRSFSSRQEEQIRNILPTHSFKIRKTLDPDLQKIIFIMDSSDHKQYGIKSEGVAFGYKGFRCLNSQNLVDDKGLCYGFQLRKGNTYTNENSVEMIHNTFSKIPKNIKKYFLADSGYSNLQVYNILLNHSAHFVICLKENVWSSLLEKYGNKINWKKTNLSFFESSKCELGNCLYPIKGLAGRSFLRVVFIRTKKEKPKPGDNHPYLYYVVVTDIPESQMDNEKIMKFYRKRALIENNIKDSKYGMDFHHFPCMSLRANNIWGVIGIISYNLMRYASFILYPNRGCFIKTTRRKLVTIAGEVINHARSIELRLMNHLAKELNRIKMMISRSVSWSNQSHLEEKLE